MRQAGRDLTEIKLMKIKLTLIEGKIQLTIKGIILLREEKLKKIKKKAIKLEAKYRVREVVVVRILLIRFISIY